LNSPEMEFLFLRLKVLWKKKKEVNVSGRVDQLELYLLCSLFFETWKVNFNKKKRQIFQAKLIVTAFGAGTLTVNPQLDLSYGTMSTPPFAAIFVNTD